MASLFHRYRHDSTDIQGRKPTNPLQGSLLQEIAGLGGRPQVCHPSIPSWWQPQMSTMGRQSDADMILSLVFPIYTHKCLN